MRLIDFYHSLPNPLRVVAASARGYFLRWWRYSKDTERLVEEALERETWPPERLEEWQQERLAETLEHAARQVPYYRAFWSERRQNGDKRAWDVLENWPVLKKSTVRDQQSAFVADDYRGKRLFEEHTSGTTGTPLTIWQSREALIGWYALFEARWRRWYGIDYHTRWAILGGQPVVPANATKPPYWIWNQAFSQLYLSSYHLSTKTVRHYIRAMQDYGVKYLYSYPSAMYTLADLAKETSVRAPKLQFALSNAETLFPYQSQLIGDVFQCEVKNTYGLSELVCAASECNGGNMHLWPEAGRVEVFNSGCDEPVVSLETGRIVATGILNKAMPLIRYEVGDLGSLCHQTCSCGRNMPILASIDGRMDDLISTSDGRSIGRLDPVFKADMPIREAQIVQESITEITVRYVPAPGLQPSHLAELDQRLHERLGEMTITYLPVKEIVRGPNGKFKAVVSKIR